MRCGSIGSRGASSWCRRSTGSTSDAGFTLLETMIALVILSFALTALYEASSTSLRAITSSWAHMKARTLAETMLAEQTSLPITRPATTRGTYEQFEWEVDVAPGTGSWAELTTEHSWTLYLIRVTVRWPVGRSLVLETARLGPRGGA